jgi:hypothetical protein
MPTPSTTVRPFIAQARTYTDNDPSLVVSDARNGDHRGPVERCP